MCRIFTSKQLTQGQFCDLRLTCPSPTVWVSMMVTTPGLCGLRRLVLWAALSSSGVTAGSVPANWVTTLPTMVRPVFKVWKKKKAGTKLTKLTQIFTTYDEKKFKQHFNFFCAAVGRLWGSKNKKSKKKKKGFRIVCIRDSLYPGHVHSMLSDSV